MNITVQISLGMGENAGALAGNATELAGIILREVGGDPDKDICNVMINDSGMAGNITLPPTQIPVPENTVINSTFATNNTPPPGDKQTRTDATGVSAVTAIYIDNDSIEGNDISASLLSLLAGDRVELRSVADSSRYGIFNLAAAPINQVDYVELPVSVVESGSNFTGGACTITFMSRL